MKTIRAVILRVRDYLGMINFQSSQKYWIDRYKRGGKSGHGSYGPLAQYKADFLNAFVETNGIETVIEHGCGDGNQLSLAKYPRYIGFDISMDAIRLCQEQFENDPSKSFSCTNAYQGEKADLSLSLDVIYHLVEDKVFEEYMRLLFSSSQRFIIIYSTNEQDSFFHAPHVRHRCFTEWVSANLPGWKLVDHIPNPLATNSYAKDTSKADFFVYQRLL